MENKGEAKERVEKAIDEIKKSHSFDSKERFNKLSDQWLSLYKLKGNKETTVEYRAYCITVMNRYIAQLKMTEIIAINLQRVLNDLFEKDTAYHMLREIHNATKMIFNYAKEVGLIIVKPVDAVFIPKKKLTLKRLMARMYRS